MGRGLLILLSVVLALAGSSMVGAEDGFYVIPTMKGKYAPVPKTGQTQPYALKDDGDLKKGVAWPVPRFIDNGNGTVTDKLTGLTWTKNATCFYQRTWTQALNDAALLADGNCGLTDGSKVGDWRLPNIGELQSLVDYGKYLPCLPADAPFANVYYRVWSSTSSGQYAWVIYLDYGSHIGVDTLQNLASVWCVRGGP